MIIILYIIYISQIHIYIYNNHHHNKTYHKYIIYISYIYNNDRYRSLIRRYFKKGALPVMMVPFCKGQPFVTPEGLIPVGLQSTAIVLKSYLDDPQLLQSASPLVLVEIQEVRTETDRGRGRGGERVRGRRRGIGRGRRRSWGA